MKNRSFLVASITCAVAASCGGGSGGGGGDPTPTTTTVTGKVSKGSVNAAAVKFYALRGDGSKGDLLGATITSADGTFELVWNANASAVLAEATAGSYANEATAGIDTLTNADTMTAVYPPFAAGYANAAITPLTHMAATRAEVLVMSGFPLATAIDTSNVGVAQQYSLASIVQTLPADANSATQVEVADRSQREYGLVLAGIAQEAMTLNVRPFDLAAALATDMEDGVLDGLGSNPIPIQTITGPAIQMLPTAGLGDLQTAIRNYMIPGGYNVTNLLGKNISTAPVIINPVGGSFYINATALPAWVEGVPGTATLTATGGTPPYTWSLVPPATLPPWLSLDANGTLTGTPPILAPGSTGRSSAPFAITCQDSAGHMQSVSFVATVVRAAPQLGWLTFGNPVLNASFDQKIATGTGGTAGPLGTYYCRLDTMGGFPPLGMVLTPDCHLKGTPKATGLTIFRVCVIDYAGASDCGKVGITVEESGGGGGGGGGGGSTGQCRSTSDCASGLICHSRRNCIISSMGSSCCECSQSSDAGYCDAAPASITRCANLGEACQASCCPGLTCVNGGCEDTDTGSCSPGCSTNG